MEYSLNIRFVAVRMITFILVTVGAVQGCTLQDGVRYVGGDMTTVSASSRESCGLLCLSTEGCSGYTFYSSGGNCNLKSSFEKVENDSKALSGIVLGRCDFDDNFEFPLFSLFSVMGQYMGIATKEECCRWCSSTTKCAGFTFFKSGAKKGLCDLKYATNNRVPSQGTTSGVRSGNSCVFEEGVDVRGVELNTTNVANKTDCCALCRIQPNCTAFSFGNIGDGSKNCALRTNTVNRIANPDAVSAISSGITCSQQSLSWRAIARSPPPRRVM